MTGVSIGGSLTLAPSDGDVSSGVQSTKKTDIPLASRVRSVPGCEAAFIGIERLGAHLDNLSRGAIVGDNWQGRLLPRVHPAHQVQRIVAPCHQGRRGDR